MKTKTFYILIAVLVFATCWLNYFLGYKAGNKEGYAYIKTIKEIQEQLGMEPNDCDGKICKMWNVPGHSKTIEAYNQAYNDQEAVKMFRRMAK